MLSLSNSTDKWIVSVHLTYIPVINPSTWSFSTYWFWGSHTCEYDTWTDPSSIMVFSSLMHCPLPKISGSFSISYHLPMYCNKKHPAMSSALKNVYSGCIYLFAHRLKGEVRLHLWNRAGTPVKSLSWDCGDQQEKKVSSRHGSFRR